MTQNRSGPIQMTAGPGGKSSLEGRLWLVSMACVAAPMALWYFSDSQVNMPILIAALGMYLIVMLSVIVMLSSGAVNLLHPLLFASCIYFIPFCIGALNLGISNQLPWYSRLLPEYDHSIILACAYMTLGYLCLCLGFYWYKGISARKIADLLPRWRSTPQTAVLPGITLVAIGGIARYQAFRVGAFGYKNSTTEYGSVYSSLSLFDDIGTFLLCWSIFSAPRKTKLHLFLALVVIARCALFILAAGGKGGPMHALLLIMLAFYASGRRLSRKHFLMVSAATVVAVVGGVVLGSAFRFILGGEQNEATLSDYLEAAGDVSRVVGQKSFQSTVGAGMNLFLQRIDGATPLAVVIARRDELRDAEEEYGIKNNIIRDTITSVIPRFLWKDKPNVADARSYTLLYFGQGDSSAAMSPVGDLLRNGGIAAVILGMSFLGASLKFGYTALVTTIDSVEARFTYCVLLQTINYEAFYSGYLPAFMRSAMICVIAGIFVNCFAVGKIARPNIARASLVRA